MAGIIGIYGLVVSVLISDNLGQVMSLYTGFVQFGAGLSVGLAGLAAGFAIGIVGDAGVRGTAQQPRLFVGMILILIFAEVLGMSSTEMILQLVSPANIPLRSVRSHRRPADELQGHAGRFVLNARHVSLELRGADKLYLQPWLPGRERDERLSRPDASRLSVEGPGIGVSWGQREFDGAGHRVRERKGNTRWPSEEVASGPRTPSAGAPRTCTIAPHA